MPKGRKNNETTYIKLSENQWKNRGAKSARKINKSMYFRNSVEKCEICTVEY